MRKLESICDAVAHYHSYHEPESDSYELRNPGMLIDESGKRRFSCHRAGYASFIDKVEKYCIAHREEPLSSLLDSLGIKMKQQQLLTVDYMSRCANATLDCGKNLSWFLES